MTANEMTTAPIVLTQSELVDITAYSVATKQLEVLHRRGFHRAYINRLGKVTLERSHYEAVSHGSAPAIKGTGKSANLGFLKGSAA